MNAFLTIRQEPDRKVDEYGDGVLHHISGRRSRQDYELLHPKSILGRFVELIHESCTAHSGKYPFTATEMATFSFVYSCNERSADKRKQTEQVLSGLHTSMVTAKMNQTAGR